MKAVYKLKVTNNVVNQAALHFKMDKVSPNNNWLDKAKEIGYFPKLSKYLKELEQEELIEESSMIGIKARRKGLTSIPSTGETEDISTNQDVTNLKNSKL